METVLEVCNSIMGWLQAALDKLEAYHKKCMDARRLKQIEKTVTKLYKLKAAWRIDIDSLDYVQHQRRKKGCKYIWEVDYRHKYLFGEDD